MAIRHYRVRPGCRFGIADHGPGDIVVLEEVHAVAFLDKLELVPEPAAASTADEPEAEEGAGAEPAPEKPPAQRRRR